MPHWALPRSAVPEESVPIRLSGRSRRLGGPRDQDADQVVGNHVAGADNRAGRVVGHSGPVVAENGRAVAVSPMMLFSIELPRASAPVT